MSNAGPDAQWMESQLYSHVALAPGCGRLRHTTAGQLDRPCRLPVPSRIEEFFSNSTELGLQI
jgi:hypothetical protein